MRPLSPAVGAAMLAARRREEALTAWTARLASVLTTEADRLGATRHQPAHYWIETLGREAEAAILRRFREEGP